jgi:membrane protein DedA with SNARE-associated domain
VLIGRLIPAIRTLISVPAGIARMTLGRFLLFSAIGTVLWSGLLAAAGYVLESEYTRVADYMDPISMIVIAVIVLGYLYRLVTYRAGTTDTKPAD